MQSYEKNAAAAQNVPRGPDRNDEIIFVGFINFFGTSMEEYFAASYCCSPASFYVPIVGVEGKSNLITHTDTPHSVGLPWMSNRLIRDRCMHNAQHLQD